MKRATIERMHVRRFKTRRVVVIGEDTNFVEKLQRYQGAAQRSGGGGVLETRSFKSSCIDPLGRNLHPSQSKKRKAPPWRGHLDIHLWGWELDDLWDGGGISCIMPEVPEADFSVNLLDLKDIGNDSDSSVDSIQDEEPSVFDPMFTSIEEPSIAPGALRPTPDAEEPEGEPGVEGPSGEAADAMATAEEQQTSADKDLHVGQPKVDSGAEPQGAAEGEAARKEEEEEEEEEDEEDGFGEEDEDVD